MKLILENDSRRLEYTINEDATWFEVTECFLDGLRGSGYIISGYNDDFIAAWERVHSGEGDECTCCDCDCDCYDEGPDPLDVSEEG